MGGRFRINVDAGYVPEGPEWSVVKAEIGLRILAHQCGVRVGRSGLPQDDHAELRPAMRMFSRHYGRTDRRRGPPNCGLQKRCVRVAPRVAVVTMQTPRRRYRVDAPNKS